MDTNLVYIMIEDENLYRKVVTSRIYQQNALNDYINTAQNQEKIYTENTDIFFSINLFNQKKFGLSGEYSDIYCFIKENKQMYLISRNFSKLSSLCGFINRVTT